jgi:hypothetical protein
MLLGVEASDIVNNRIAIDYLLELTSGVTGRIVDPLRSTIVILDVIRKPPDCRPRVAFDCALTADTPTSFRLVSLNDAAAPPP